MKTSAKQKLIKTVEIIDRLLELKCGGEGGTMGPCPSGNSKPSGGGGGKPPYAQKPKPSSATATEKPKTDSGDMDFKEIQPVITAARKQHVEKMAGAIKSNPHVTDLKVNSPNLESSFGDTSFAFGYKGHPVSAKMSNSGYSLAAGHPGTLSTKQAQSLSGFFKQLDKSIKDKSK